jgi:hypothetical protein
MAADLVAHYEQLRSDALSYSAGGRGHGLGMIVFLRQGMLSWMRAWSRYSGGSLSPSPPPAQGDTTVPVEIRSQITTILAAMIVGQQPQEVFREP